MIDIPTDLEVINWDYLVLWNIDKVIFGILNLWVQVILVQVQAIQV